MSIPLELESTLTDRYQTTVPGAVRRALKLGKRDKLRYVLQADGAVQLERAAPPEADDPALEQFLHLLARSIQAQPDRLRGIDAAWLARMRSLVAGVEVDLDALLDPDAQ